MSILIKGMEMPTNCGECELCACYVFEDGTEENYRCPMTMYPIHDFDERHYLCPLVPVPPHGRLIDADALEKDIDEYIGGEETRSRFHHWVQVQRTVIPESKEART